MADSDWTGYVGMATGVFGAVVGYLGYRRATHIKNLDMRLELRKALREAHESIRTLPEIIEQANRSRRAVMAARGHGRSGAMNVWVDAVTRDREAVTNIAPTVRDEGADFTLMTAEQLEEEIIAVDKINATLRAMLKKYEDARRGDDETRAQIGQQVTAMAAARMAQPPASPPR